MTHFHVLVDRQVVDIRFWNWKIPDWSPIESVHYDDLSFIVATLSVFCTDRTQKLHDDFGL